MTPTYRLSIRKKFHYRGGDWTREEHYSIHFAVVDLDKGAFPNNYVCNLPKFFDHNKFSELFKPKTNHILLAKELLKTAKKEYPDPLIQREIDVRLLIIEQYVKCFSS